MTGNISCWNLLSTLTWNSQNDGWNLHCHWKKKTYKANYVVSAWKSTNQLFSSERRLCRHSFWGSKTCESIYKQPEWYFLLRMQAQKRLVLVKCTLLWTSTQTNWQKLLSSDSDLVWKDPHEVCLDIWLDYQLASSVWHQVCPSGQQLPPHPAIFIGKAKEKG